MNTTVPRDKAKEPELKLVVDAVTPAIGPESSAGAAVRAALTDAVDRIVHHDAGMRAGDVESLHQARVGLRRLRSHLRLFAPLLDGPWSDSLNAELHGLARQLGEVRNLDVLINRLGSIAADLRPVVDPLLDDLAGRRDADRHALLEVLGGERHSALLERLVAAAAAPPLLPSAGRPAATILPPLFDAAWRRLAKHGDRMNADWADTDYHELRIRTKR